MRLSAGTGVAAALARVARGRIRPRSDAIEVDLIVGALAELREQAA